MRKFELYVAGEPVAQGRPRFSSRSGFVKAYDPKKSSDQKQMIGILAREAIADSPMLEGCLALTLDVYCHYPKSWSKKKIKSLLEGDVYFKETKPDLDNYIKLVLDSLNTIVFHDDSKVVRITASKHWSDHDGTKILLEELGERE